MKKLALLIVLAFGISITYYSCEQDDGGDCAYCKSVQKDNAGAVITEGIEEEYCLDDLDELRNTPPITDPEGNVTQWVCD